MSKNYFHAIATLVGTTVGVGIFAIPYVINKSGLILLFLYLPFLGIVQYWLQRFYAEIILSTKDKHRIPGYAKKYLGKKGEALASVTAILGVHGALLAYIIVGGIFLHKLLLHTMGTDLGLNIFIWATILFIINSLIVLAGLKLIASAELVMAGLLILMVGLITWRGHGYIRLDNYTLINWSNIFLPYGPIFFSVGGLAATPLVCKLLAQKKENIKSVLLWGTIISVLITLIFAMVIVGITGINTSPDTLVGLSSVLGDGVITFSLIFGLLSIITSFLIIAQALREVYWWDFKMNKNLAWALASGAPYLIYLAGWQNLIEVVSLTGAIAGGLLGIILILLIFKVKEKREQVSIIENRVNKPAALGLSLLFILGLVYTVWTVFSA